MDNKYKIKLLKIKDKIFENLINKNRENFQLYFKIYFLVKDKHNAF